MDDLLTIQNQIQNYQTQNNKTNPVNPEYSMTPTARVAILTKQLLSNNPWSKLF